MSYKSQKKSESKRNVGVRRGIRNTSFYFRPLMLWVKEWLLRITQYPASLRRKRLLFTIRPNLIRHIWDIPCIKPYQTLSYCTKCAMQFKHFLLQTVGHSALIFLALSGRPFQVSFLNHLGQNWHQRRRSHAYYSYLTYMYM